MIRKVNLIGLGAIGMLVGSQIQKEIGNVENGQIHFVMDRARYERHKKDPYTINGEPFPFHLQPADEAEPADLLILAVKYTSLDEVLDIMASSVDSHTIILSLLNGISSEDIIAGRYPGVRIIDSIAMGMDAVREGTDLTYSVHGAIRMGIRDNKDEKMAEALADVKDFFDKVHAHYVAEPDIRYRLWYKYMINVGINQICMVFNVGYGKALAEQSEELMVMSAAMREVILVAAAEGVTLTEADLHQSLELLRSLDPEACPSMRQDRLAQRKSEVELFAGTMVKLGEKHGIITPANDWLYRRVKEIEAEYK